MKEIRIDTRIRIYAPEELQETEQMLFTAALEATEHSYAP